TRQAEHCGASMSYLWKNEGNEPDTLGKSKNKKVHFGASLPTGRYGWRGFRTPSRGTSSGSQGFEEREQIVLLLLRKTDRESIVVKVDHVAERRRRAVV